MILKEERSLKWSKLCSISRNPEIITKNNNNSRSTQTKSQNYKNPESRMQQMTMQTAEIEKWRSTSHWTKIQQFSHKLNQLSQVHNNSTQKPPNSTNKNINPTDPPKSTHPEPKSNHMQQNQTTQFTLKTKIQTSINLFFLKSIFLYNHLKFRERSSHLGSLLRGVHVN